MKPITDFLKQVPDHRRKQGQRTPHLSFLEMIILGGMSGYFGIRPVARFIKNNASFFESRYKLLHGVPGTSTVQNYLSGLSYNKLTNALYEWSKQYLDKNIWTSIDGKAIGSTLRNSQVQNQNFKSLVSLFCSSKGIVIHNKSMENKKSSEIQSARELIGLLDLKGITFTLDALHCQKKQLNK